VAKQQSFADKSKSKKQSDHVDVKCIVSQYDEATKSWKFRERMVQVASTNDLKDMKF
jgi:hypothetical protein